MDLDPPAGDADFLDYEAHQPPAAVEVKAVSEAATRSLNPASRRRSRFWAARSALRWRSVSFSRASETLLVAVVAGELRRAAPFRDPIEHQKPKPAGRAGQPVQAHLLGHGNDGAGRLLTRTRPPLRKRFCDSATAVIGISPNARGPTALRLLQQPDVVASDRPDQRHRSRPAATNETTAGGRLRQRARFAGRPSLSKHNHVLRGQGPGCENASRRVRKRPIASISSGMITACSPLAHAKPRPVIAHMKTSRPGANAEGARPRLVRRL